MLEKFGKKNFLTWTFSVKFFGDKLGVFTSEVYLLAAHIDPAEQGPATKHGGAADGRVDEQKLKNVL